MSSLLGKKCQRSSLLGKNSKVVFAGEKFKGRLCLRFLQKGGGEGGEDFFLGPRIFFYREGGGRRRFFFRTEDFFLQGGGGGEDFFLGLNFFLQGGGGEVFGTQKKEKVLKGFFFPPRGLHCSHSDIAIWSAD